MDSSQGQGKIGVDIVGFATDGGEPVAVFITPLGEIQSLSLHDGNKWRFEAVE